MPVMLRLSLYLILIHDRTIETQLYQVTWPFEEYRIQISALRNLQDTSHQSRKHALAQIGELLDPEALEHGVHLSTAQHISSLYSTPLPAIIVWTLKTKKILFIQLMASSQAFWDSIQIGKCGQKNSLNQSIEKKILINQSKEFITKFNSPN